MNYRHFSVILDIFPILNLISNQNICSKIAPGYLLIEHMIDHQSEQNRFSYRYLLENDNPVFEANIVSLYFFKKI